MRSLLALSAAAAALVAGATADRQLLCGATLNGVGGDMGSLLEKKSGIVKPVSVLVGVECGGGRCPFRHDALHRM